MTHQSIFPQPSHLKHMPQEIQRLQRVVAKVRSILMQLQQAIKGEVVMTEELQETLYAVYDAKVWDAVPRCNIPGKYLF